MWKTPTHQKRMLRSSYRGPGSPWTSDQLPQPHVPRSVPPANTSGTGGLVKQVSKGFFFFFKNNVKMDKD